MTIKGVKDLSSGQKIYGGFLTAGWLALLTGLALPPTAVGQVIPRVWLLHELPRIAAPQYFPHRGTAKGLDLDGELSMFGYARLAMDARHYPGPGAHGQFKLTTAAWGWRSVPAQRGGSSLDLQLGVDFAKWRPLRSHGPGEKELTFSPSQRSPMWALDRLRVGIPLRGDFRVAFTDPQENKGFIRSPVGWPSAGWVALPPPVLAAEISREKPGHYEGRVWVGQGLADAVNILEGGMAVAGYLSPGILGYSRGTISQAKPDRTSLQFKSMVRSDWQAGIVSDGRWPLAYGLYFGVGFGGSSGDTDRPLEATIAGRCYQCFAKFQRYQRNIVMGYATYFILARYFIHLEGQDLQQKVGKATTTDYYTYQAVGTLLGGGDLGMLSLGFYRGHRSPYPAIAPDSIEPAKPAFLLRWSLGAITLLNGS